MKDIKDYIHYYIGQRFIFDNKIWNIVRVSTTLVRGVRNENGEDKFMQVYHHEAKLLLRRLSDMSEEEVKELIGWEKMNVIYSDLRYKKLADCINIEYSIDAGGEGCYPQFHSISFLNPTPQQFHYLLKQGFDLFGLVDAGLAIDAATIQPTQK